MTYEPNRPNPYEPPEFRPIQPDRGGPRMDKNISLESPTRSERTLAALAFVSAAALIIVATAFLVAGQS